MDIQIPDPKDFYIVVHSVLGKRVYSLIEGKDNVVPCTSILNDVVIYSVGELRKVYPNTGGQGQ